ncbi:RagB/SusD family nutrient uptake outer membrane protein [Chryseolinea soli]|uniref:RagB/SusD family nutrient uptake outer membrane protein n=1 Tax=Chryseolinea soli TaxID=2321403 RepID=A0A385SMF9_9BACT|nr:RagB/SusD family nutrient uptake outer membrane protein [Chryseolinea soli]AYB32022.1 RagB/SusD family nutrient uptake outer membrane protein [Chryseolinea soli]
MKRNIIQTSAIVLAAAFVLQSCVDFLDVEKPTTQIGSTAVFEDEATANAAILGIYSAMTNSAGFVSGGLSSITSLAGRSADDFINYAPNAPSEFAANELTENNTYVNEYIWKEAYRYIYDVNAIIEGVSKSSTLSVAAKTRFAGEAKFLRAFFYFYLVNLFQNVPLVTTTDYRLNSIKARSSADEVYIQIVDDLLSAKASLTDDYTVSDGQKTRANRLAAIAMLARVYLYQHEWEKAESEATLVLESTIQLENDIDKVFLKNSNEAIWQLIPPEGSFATNEGSMFVLTGMPSEVSLSQDLIETFEENDLRKSHWTGSLQVEANTFFFPFKYKIKTGETELSEYSMILRIGEQYLIRAEARAHQNKIQAALVDIDGIRQRASLPLLQDTHPAITQPDLLLAIEQERRVELFSEWGHRWFDLKRTNRADQILADKFGSSWQSSDVLYPVPLQEIQNNQNLLPQNPGY